MANMINKMEIVHDHFQFHIYFNYLRLVNHQAQAGITAVLRQYHDNWHNYLLQFHNNAPIICHSGGIVLGNGHVIIAKRPDHAA